MREHHHQDFAAKKSLGQNFLTSNVVPGWMCDAGSVQAGDTVLEIGPGTGALTAEILRRGARVVAIETDARAITRLGERFPHEIATGLLSIIGKDARELALDTIDLPSKYKVISNIPYYLSGYLLRLCLESNHQPSTLVFLMQKEVVERIARDQKSSLLSISIRVFGTPRYVKTVGRGHFSPQPKVDSAILLISDISTPFKNPSERAQFFEILHHGFGKKRKQLIANLSARLDRSTLEVMFSNLNLSLTVRAEDLDHTTWLTLHQRLTAAGYTE